MKNKLLPRKFDSLTSSRNTSIIETNKIVIRGNFRSNSYLYLGNKDIKPKGLLSPVPRRKTTLHITKSNNNDELKLANYISFPKSNIVNCIEGKRMTSFAYNTYQGRIRNYNEDKIAIEINVPNPSKKPVGTETWPSIDYFAIFDGHGGATCSEYLKKNLLDIIINDSSFPQDPIKAIKSAFEKAEALFVDEVIIKNGIESRDPSGSCALILLIINDICYCVSLGDSRALYSENQSHKVNQISIEHKPNLEAEKKRIHEAGGEIEFDDIWRISPGNLAVSRAFGDYKAKESNYGGNPNVLISTPEITTFKLTDKSDFILLGSDGIFDDLSNKEIIKHIWKVKREKNCLEPYDKRTLTGDLVDSVIEYAMESGSTDNVSCVLILFPNFNKIRTNFMTPLKYIDQLVCSEAIIKSDINNNPEDENIKQIEKYTVFRIPRKTKTNNDIKCFNSPRKIFLDLKRSNDRLTDTKDFRQFSPRKPILNLKQSDNLPIIHNR